MLQIIGSQREIAFRLAARKGEAPPQAGNLVPTHLQIRDGRTRPERGRIIAAPDYCCCCSASRAPSATKAAEKLRRIQIITRGLPTTLSRMAAANRP